MVVIRVMKWFIVLLRPLNQIYIKCPFVPSSNPSTFGMPFYFFNLFLNLYQNWNKILPLDPIRGLYTKWANELGLRGFGVEPPLFFGASKSTKYRSPAIIGTFILASSPFACINHHLKSFIEFTIKGDLLTVIARQKYVSPRRMRLLCVIIIIRSATMARCC